MGGWLPRLFRWRKHGRRRDIEWNHSLWGTKYDWSRGGEEWSDPWGSSEAQWYGSLLPRLRGFLPAETVLEIAPGHGRWTKFLAPGARRYYGVDLSPACVEHCRRNFPSPSMEFFVNDGRSLSMIPDGTVDLCFSFDSLVHAEIDVMESYISQIRNKLTPFGVAFIHHSNFAEFFPADAARHQRAVSVSAAAIRSSVEAAGGHVLRHEIIAWRGVDSLDALLLFARSGAFDAETAIVRNPDFPAEAENVRRWIAPWRFRRRGEER